MKDSLLCAINSNLAMISSILQCRELRTLAKERYQMSMMSAAEYKEFLEALTDTLAPNTKEGSDTNA